jgi:hypothetical protein
VIFGFNGRRERERERERGKKKKAIKEFLQVSTINFQV